MNQNSFKELGLHENVLKAIDTLGFTEPSKIQKEIIPLILDGLDVVGQAQTGTGKTLAFAASILSKMESNHHQTKAIVLTPTRELALQVCKEFESLNASHFLHTEAVFGGSSIQAQIRAFQKGVDIVVGTPGRVMDLIKRGVLKLDHLEYFVLDEADEMLNMGFLEDIEFIFEKTNPDKQVLMFSATMPKTILTLAKKYMKKNFCNVAIEEKSETAINVKQRYYVVNEKSRLEALCRVLDQKNPKVAIIFCARKTDVDNLLAELSTRHYRAEAMHGDITQNMRMETLERFKNKKFPILIATDVAARGIHVDHVDLVVNYQIPQDVESYVHRIGRTGRAGNSGEAITFVNHRDVRFMDDVRRITKCELEESPLPQPKEIREAKYDKILSDVNDIIGKKDYEECMEYVRDQNKDQLLKTSAALLALLFQKELGSDLQQEVSIKRIEKRSTQNGMTRVFLTIGKMDQLKKGTLLDFLKEKTEIRKECFQNIEILNKFTFMDVEDNEVDRLITKVYNQKLNGRIIRVEKSTGKKK